MIALGGVTCALGGAAWGASGLAGQPSTHLTVSLLMIGKCTRILLNRTVLNEERRILIKKFSIKMKIQSALQNIRTRWRK